MIPVIPVTGGEPFSYSSGAAPGDPILGIGKNLPGDYLAKCGLCTYLYIVVIF
jgi:hypothetical protein